MKSKIATKLLPICALGLTLHNVPATADIVPSSSEVQVNLPTVGWQYYPRVAADASGNYVISYISSVGDASSGFIQWYSADGVFQGGREYVGASVTDVAVNAAGTAVAVFSAGPRADVNVHIQVFDSAGNPRFFGLPRLNAVTAGNQVNPSVAINDAGEIIVAWESRPVDGDPNSTTIFLRQLTTDGFFISPEIEIEKGPWASPTQKTIPDVGINAAGDFVVVWTDSPYYRVPIRNLVDVYAQRFQRGGQSLGRMSRVNSTAVEMQRYGRVAVSQDTGDYVISWHSLAVPPTSAWQLYMQRYDSDGSKLGSERRFDDGTTLFEPNIEIVMNGDGIVAAWGEAGSERDVYVRSFNLDGTDRSPVVRMNEFVPGLQWMPAVSLLPDSELVAAWASSGQDGDAFGVFSRRFLNP